MGKRRKAVGLSVLKVSLLFMALLGAPSAMASLSGVALGVSLPTPMGNLYATLNRNIGFQGDIFYEWGALGSQFELDLTGMYQTYKVRSNDAMSLNLLGFLAGVKTRHSSAKNGALFHPFIGAQAGGVFEWTGFSNASSTTQNNALSLAAQVTPGVEVPVASPVSAMLEFPMMGVFIKNPVFIWSGLLSLKWNL